MPNIAAVLKEEIRRLAKKEVKTPLQPRNTPWPSTAATSPNSSGWFASNKQEWLRFAKQSPTDRDQPPAAEEPLADIRYSARSVRAQRSRLGFSAEDYGKLVGVSGLTIYNWEHEKARPRKVQLAALIAVRGIGKREALKRLEAVGAGRDANAADKRSHIGKVSVILSAARSSSFSAVFCGDSSLRSE